MSERDQFIKDVKAMLERRKEESSPVPTVGNTIIDNNKYKPFYINSHVSL